MQVYLDWVTLNPMLSAAIQFAILGTFGEIISFSIQKKKFAIPCSWLQLMGKMIAWAGMKGFTQALLDHQLLPAFLGAGLGKAFTVSVFTNVFFGPQMMAFHRVEDNLILGQKGFHGITKAWKTLIWFWIPAHTITFLLPADLQIGLAALWSLVLGIIMGATKK